jgi:hypothetical protein
MIHLKATLLLLLLVTGNFAAVAQDSKEFYAYVNKLFYGFPLDSNQQQKVAFMSDDGGFVKNRKTVDLSKMLKYEPASAYIYSMSENLTLLSIEYADIDQRTSFKQFGELTKKLKKIAPLSELKKVEAEAGQTAPPDLQYSFYRQKGDTEPVLDVFLLEGYKMIYVYYYRKPLAVSR